MIRKIYTTTLRVTSNFTRSKLQFSQTLNRTPRYNFSSKDPLKGFEKYKRANKSKSEENSSSPADQKIDIDKPTPKPEESKSKQEENAPKEEKKPEEKQKEEKVDSEEADSGKKHKKSSDGKGSDPKGPFKPTVFHYAGAGLVALIAAQYGFDYYMQKETISYTEFVRNYLETDRVKSITIQSLTTNGSKRPYAIFTDSFGVEKAVILGNVDHFLENLEKHQLQRGVSPDRLIPVTFGNGVDSNMIFDRIHNVIYLGATIALLYMVSKQLKGMGGMMGGGGNNPLSMGKTHVQIYGVDKKIGTKFKDVAGLDEAKVEIMEFVDFLKKPEKFNKIGAKIPRGALLSGPPGTGKTMLAKAAAGEAGVPFLYISGSDFVEMFVGVGASRVRDLFTQAKKHAPSIIFIDEIDAVGKKRDNRMGNDEKDNTLNQLLVEMDGFSTDQSVVILGATNRKELLDPALTRPGRFDRSIEVTLPDLEGRKQIFLVHLKPIKLDPSKTPEEYAKRLATLTPGFSGADIANLCNEAAILSARKGKDSVSTEEFESASERVLAGLEKKRIISEEEKKIVSVHESGHAVVSWFLEGGYPLLKLTIIPRSKGSLGFAQYLPNESSLQTKEELMDRICCILGGRCSEEFFNGKVTTGAYDDLKKAYDIARSMVMQFGMSDKIGFIGYSEDEYVKKHSEDTAKEIDREIKRIIDECTEKTRAVVKEHAKEIKLLSERLLEKETLDLQAIIEVLGERPFAPKSNFKAYLEYKTKGEEVGEKKPEEKNEKKDDDNDGDGGNKEKLGKTPKLKPKTA